MSGQLDALPTLPASGVFRAATSEDGQAQQDLIQLARLALQAARGRWAAVVVGRGAQTRCAATAGEVTPALLAALSAELPNSSAQWWQAQTLTAGHQAICRADPPLRWLAHLPLMAARDQPQGALLVAADEASPDILRDLEWLIQVTVNHLTTTRTNQALRLATVRLTSLVTNLQDGLLVEDEHGRVTQTNGQFCELFRIPVPPEALHGQLCVDLMSQAGPMVGDIEAFMGRVKQLLGDHRLVTGEMIILTDGRVLERDFIPYDDGTGNHARMWLYRDVTARVRAEQAEHEHAEQLAAANARLEEATRLKDQFLASMSHELRTPLNAVLGMSEALIDQVFGPVRPEQMRPLQAISDCGQHLLAMINDLLDLARIGAGKLELELDHVDVNSLAQGAVHLLRAAASRKQVELSARLADGLPLLLVDARRIRQVLANLLDNSIKFCVKGGSVGLEVGAGPEARTIELTVWDTGPGIAAEDLPKLFKPFAQLDRGLDRRHQGAGMGLMMAERLAHLHGGRLTVQSELGRGSRFTLHLPLQTAPLTEPSAAPIATPSAQLASAPLPAPVRPGVEPVPHPPEAPLVLVVEDNDLNLEIIQRFLISKGYRVAAARNGSAALDLAAAAIPALVLMDVQMPGMDGLEATRRLRQDPRFKHLPVIALTALAMEGDRERCLAAGATDYLAKPVSLRQLALLLPRYLRPEPSSSDSEKPST
jgi:signal transduction histidine kinase/CheY-like chemotaxis protein